MRRSRREIKFEILENSMENIKPTHLMRDVNVSYTTLNSCLTNLQEQGFIEGIRAGERELKRDGRTKITYRTTTKGVNIVKTFRYVTKSIDKL